MVHRVFGGNAGVVMHVAVRCLSGRERGSARRGRHEPNQGKRKRKMGHRAKQAHGREAKDASLS